jgi:hypothetical protein
MGNTIAYPKFRWFMLVTVTFGYLEADGIIAASPIFLPMARNSKVC